MLNINYNFQFVISNIFFNVYFSNSLEIVNTKDVREADTMKKTIEGMFDLHLSKITKILFKVSDFQYEMFNIKIYNIG